MSMLKRRVITANNNQVGVYEPSTAAIAANIKPELTLAEQLMLLTMTEQRGSSLWNDRLSYALRACFLIDLCLKERITVRQTRNMKMADRQVLVTDASPVGDTLIDETLEHIQSVIKPRPVADWMDILSGDVWLWTLLKHQIKNARQRVTATLASKGILRTKVTSLWVASHISYPWRDVCFREDFYHKVSDFLLMEISVDQEEAWLRMAVVVSLAYLVNALPLVLIHLPSKKREKALQRAALLLTQLSQSTDHVSPKRQLIANALTCLMHDF
ncbi:Golgi phosphoprotein 3-domain-containing protein [Gongronella butleri]|nr:Golgi phosphoprotein 3-domain-containing protein [Gongronella butleri]